MFSKSSSAAQKRHAANIPEDEPPDKKMVSDADIFIKRLAEKQLNTQLNLKELLSSKNDFYKATEVVSLTNYACGTSTLKKFASVLSHSDQIEKFKSWGLTDEEIRLYLDSLQGGNHFADRCKKVDGAVMDEQLGRIHQKISQYRSKTQRESATQSRLLNETALSAKPTSTETKLLKFALKNKPESREKLPHPMDDIKDVEKELTNILTPISPKKVIKKCRNLGRKIEALSTVPVMEPQKIKHQPAPLNSKWDLKVSHSSTQNTQVKKLFTCQPLHYYTVKDSQIVKLDASRENTKQLSLEEIRNIPKFSNYDSGDPSKNLFIKNLERSVTEEELRKFLSTFSNHIVSVNVMGGRMRGQAFIETDDQNVAQEILEKCNGVVLKQRPVIISFGKRK